MRRFLALWVVPLALVLISNAAFAQDGDQKWKEDVLRKIEERLKTEEDRILKEIEELIDSELSGKPAPATKPATSGKPYLGVVVDEVDPGVRAILGLTKGEGLQVTDVVADGPAAKGGVELNDVVLEIDGTKIGSFEDLASAMSGKKPGDVISATINRRGSEQDVNITLGARKADTASGTNPSGNLRDQIEDFLSEESGKPTKKPSTGTEEGPAEEPAGEAFDVDEFFKDFIMRKPDKEEDDHPFRKRMRAVLESEEGAFLGELIKQMMGQAGGGQVGNFFEKRDDGHWYIKEEFTGQLDQMGEQLDQMLEQFGLGDIGKEGTEEEPKDEPKSEPVPQADRPWLGLQPNEVSAELRTHLGLGDGEGLIVEKVYGDSPAESAGIKVHDVLLEVNGKAASFNTLDAVFAGAKIGDKLEVTLLRKGTRHDVTVTLGKREGR